MKGGWLCVSGMLCTQQFYDAHKEGECASFTASYDLSQERTVGRGGGGGGEGSRQCVAQGAHG